MRIVRRTTAAAVLAATCLAAAACSPGTAVPAGEKAADDKSGTLQVWLYNEAGNAAKEAVVAKAVTEFQSAHQGVTVNVSYIDTDASARAAKMKGAFNDPNSAPDLVEFGNTDLPGYVAAGGLAEIGADLDTWAAKGDLDPAIAKTAVLDGKTYGLPWWVGVRALYYRTDLFTEAGLAAPTSYDELVAATRKIHAAHSDTFGIAIGGKYTFGALPFVWDAGGDIATKDGDKFKAAIGSAASQAGVKRYTDLFDEAGCPAQQCADLTGGKTVDLFAAGKAAMAILPNSSRSKVDAGAAKDKYAVVPLPGAKAGSIAPAFAGGNNLGVMKAAKHRTLAVQFAQLLAGPGYQEQMYDAMGNLPTLKSVNAKVATKDAFLKPFTDTIAAGTRFVPLDQAWAQIDAQAVIPTMLQQVVTGRADVAKASGDAATQITSAFAAR
ncbi:extracellular solute-binding protein [Kitasatospora purpeofusca]|uniref:extracellular solute-binding protein n=1 Tax=Kitasatospora purpeofusca TaxID=67352 RepID=UPI0022565F0E|nr:extracellular solute-binding protein [Kitasatospora purpeofusca]MCX4756343.1 extracellular solute-binding protein [Kitasatospora purpeofusca]WSR35831.1 extracellular solute-binding protein [Kitasatospora purpeofusca]